MKTLTIAVLFLTALFACKKPDTLPETKSETIEVAIDQRSVYEYDLGAVPAELVDVTTQPAHGSQSRLVNIAGSNTTIYQYVPDSLYSGQDEVTLQLPPPPKHKHDNACNKGDKPAPPRSSVTIKFTVAQSF
jgi:hypothetical protein